jgi:hypothetical protein
MNPVWMIKRVIRFGFRMLAMPALIASLALGVGGGQRGVNVHLSPQPQVVIQELRTHQSLPKGTKLTLGDAKRPFTVLYDDRGRLTVTPPKGETFGTILTRGYAQLGLFAESSARFAQNEIGGAVAQTHSASSTKAQ